MKKLLSIFIPQLCAVVAACALNFSNDNVLVNFESSYDTQPYHYHGDYLAALLHLTYPNQTNRWYTASHSGGSIQDANETRLERLGLAHWAHASQCWGIVAEDGNGGYSSNTVRIHLTNTLAAPGLFFNGTAYTNEGGAAAGLTIRWIGQGTIPANQSDGQTMYRDGNNAVTNMFAGLGLPYVNEWWPLEFGGWSNDVNNATGFNHWNPDSHPGAPGQLTMGINRAAQLGFPTNVSYLAVDWLAAAVVNTNACAVASVSRSGNVLSFTYKLDRMAMPFDVPDGTITNDCRDAFNLMPPFGNAFTEILQLTNLPVGKYNVTIDGSNVVVLTDAQLESGWNRFTNYAGAEWAQKKEVLGRVRDLNGADRTTLLDHSAGSQGTTGGPDMVNYFSNSQSFWNSGDRGDALIADLATFETSLDTYNALISAAAVQTNHTMTVSLILPRYAGRK